MPGLGQNRLSRLATCICGDGESGNFDYRRHADLDAFFPSVEGGPTSWTDPEASRHERAYQFTAACNRTDPGRSGLPRAIETVIREVLNLGQFDDVPQRDAAVREVQEILDGYHVAVDVNFDSEIRPRSTRTDARQRVIDAELHTSFGEVLHEADLRVARVHYVNAKRLIDDDFANAAKEAVCAVEACLCTLTGERELKKALRQATDAVSRNPWPQLSTSCTLGGATSPGAHGANRTPAVTKADAQFALNMAATINLYLRQRLSVAEGVQE